MNRKVLLGGLFLALPLVFLRGNYAAQKPFAFGFDALTFFDLLS